MKLVRLTAYRTIPMTSRRQELGAIDGEELHIWANDDGEIQVTNGSAGMFGEPVFDWSDLVGPDYERDMPIRVELTIIDDDPAASAPSATAATTEGES